MVGKRLPNDPGGKRTMSTIEESVDVEVPVSTAYNQWTQFEEFPRFMDGVESITQVDETHLRWVADIGGVRREWDAEISEQVGDKLGFVRRRAKGDLGRFKEFIESRGSETGAWRGDVESPDNR